MTSDKKMYVYVDTNFNIKAISPVKDDSHDYKFMLFPVDDVRVFLEGKASLSQYKLMQDTKDITKFNIVPKIIEINTIRYITSFLSPVEYKDINAHIQITHFTKSKKIEVRMLKKTRLDILEKNKTEKGNITVISVPSLRFYFCASEDPCFMILSVDVSTDSLINEWGQTIFYDIQFDMSNATIFTKKVFPKYSYEVIDE